MEEGKDDSMEILYDDYSPRVESVIRNISWRFRNTYGLDDLRQESWIVFLDAKRRYAKSVKNKAHFAALFFRVLHSHYTRLSNNHQSSVDASAASFVSVDSEGVETDLLELMENTGLENLSLEKMVALNDLPFNLSEVVNWGKDSLEKNKVGGYIQNRATTRECLIEEFGMDVLELIKEAIE